MDLKTVFSSISDKVSGTKKDQEVLLSVKISSTQISAATWTIVDGKVQLGEVSQAEISSESFEELLKNTDKAVSPLGDTVDKVIFGLPFSWVENAKVTPEKLTLLRRLCKELELKPMGFVLLSEVLENYYKEIEGAPLTALLIEVDGNVGLLTMYRAGKNLGKIEIKSFPDEIVAEVEKALKQFVDAEILPSRIIIYDGKKDLEALAEKITAHPWTKTHAFLHFPKVEILPSENVVKAIAIAGALEMGAHFEDEVLEPETSVSMPISQLLEEQTPELEEINAQEVGFVPEMEIQPFGPPVPSVEKVNYKEKITGLIHGLKFKMPKVYLPKLSFKAKFPIIGMALVLLLAFAAAIYFIPKTKIIIKVATSPFDKELQVVVTTTATNSANAITGSIVSVTEIGTKKGITTGQKLVGDKARGTVTIHSASSAKNFPSGTTVTAPGGLKFTLDRDVSIASGDAISRATISVPVTAADIGETYNLAAGTKFTLGNLSSSDYAAQADQALSGGNSHQATVVTKEDQARLMATLSAELTATAKIDLETKLTANQKLLPSAISSQTTKKKFSKDVGEEADTVSLDLTMDFAGVIFDQNDLVAVFAKNFSTDIPSNFALLPDRVNIDIGEVKTDKQGNALLKVHLNSFLLPQMDSNEIIRNLAGKSQPAGLDYLSKLPSVTNTIVETKPKLFELVTKLFFPWKKDNISVEIVSQ